MALRTTQLAVEVLQDIPIILIGPTMLWPGHTGTYTLTPINSYTGVITLSDGGAGGTFNPTSLNYSASNAAQTFTYTRPSIGVVSLSVSASPALNVPFPLNVLFTQPKYYDNAIIADLPISYWAQADPSGIVAVDGSDSNPGTYFGGFTLGGPAPYPGMAGSAAYDGATGYIRIPAATNLNPTGTAFSVECWIKTTSAATMVAVGHYKSTSPNQGYGIALKPGAVAGVAGFWVGDPTGGWVTGGPAVNDGGWHHVVGTILGSTVTLYVDGVSVVTGTRTVSASYIGDLTIGAAVDVIPYNWFSGSIPSVTIYNYALTPTQVAAHRWASVGSLSLGTIAKPTLPVLQSAWTGNILAAYNLGEGSGTAAADLSGNSHTGTRAGNCTWSSGSYGNQLSFADNGTTGSYLDLGSLSALVGVTALTFSALCQLNTYTDAPRGGNIRMLIGTTRAAASYPQCSIFYHASDRTIHFNARYNNYPDLIAPAPPLNQWILITGRITGNVQSLWYDGTKVAEQTIASYAFASDSLPIGAIGDAQAYSPGNNWSGLVSMPLMATRGYGDVEIISLATDPFVWDRVPSSSFGAALLMGM